MRIYIAGPLSSKEKSDRNPSEVVVDYLQNVSRMCKVGSQVRKLGHIPFVPALDLLMGVINGDWDENMYRDIGMSFVEVCDAILITEMSWGVQQELEKARALGIKVFYNVNDIPNA